MIITLTSVIGNGKHHGKTIREVIDSDPEYIIWWKQKVYGLRFDTASNNYLAGALVRQEATRRLIFEDVEESSF